MSDKATSGSMWRPKPWKRSPRVSRAFLATAERRLSTCFKTPSTIECSAPPAMDPLASDPLQVVLL